MNIVIADDDLKFAEKIKEDVFRFFSSRYNDISIHIVNNHFHSILDFQSIDVLFLDIDLEMNYNGISLGKYIKSIFPNVIIVFVSLHDDFVFSALSINFFQFIRKSKYEYDFYNVCNQIKQYLDENMKKIILNIKGRTVVIKYSDIQYIISIGHDLLIQTVGNEYTTTSSLKKFMLDIDYKELIQIERNLVINLNYVKKVTRTEIVMLDLKKYVVGRKYQKGLLSAYEEFLLR